MKKFTTEQLKTMVEEVNAQNSSLEHLSFYPMDMLDEILINDDATRIANMIHFGDFRITDDYFGFDGYANLKSLTQTEYDELLNEYHDEIVDAFEYEVEIGNLEDSQNLFDELKDTKEL